MQSLPPVALALIALAGLLTAVRGAPLTGVHVNPADVPRAIAWEQWTGKAPDIIGDNFFANTWPELAAQVPGAGVAFSLDQHVPPPGRPPNPLLGRSRPEFAVPLFPKVDSDGTPFRSIPDRLARGAAGAYDIWWQKLAEELVARGLGDCWLRPGWELNIPDPLTQGWDDGLWKIGNSSVLKHQQYAAYWRRCHDAMMAVTGARFQWVWCLLAGVETIDSAQQVLDYAYPGNAYVNFISADVYDTSNFARYSRGHWQENSGRWLNQVSMPDMDDRTWEELSSGIRRSPDLTGSVIQSIPCLDLFRAFARQQGKPFLLSEWGIEQTDRALPSWSQPNDAVPGGNDNPRFIAAIAKWAADNEVYAVTYFDFFLSRHSPAYDGARPTIVDSALLPGFWNTQANVDDKPLHPLSMPHPRSAAAYLAAFHPAKCTGIPLPWRNDGIPLVTHPRELAPGSMDTVAIDPMSGNGWTLTTQSPFPRVSTGAAIATAFTPLSRHGASSHTVSANIRAGAVGQWAGIAFLTPLPSNHGYAFEARCGPDGLPDGWRLLKNGSLVWQSTRPPLLAKLTGANWLHAPIPMAVTTKPGPESSLRIEMHFGPDTAGHFNDPAPLPATATNRSGIITGGTGATVDQFDAREPLADEDFEDGSAEGWTGSGWTTRRLQYHAALADTGRQALAGQDSDKNYAVSAQVALTSQGPAGLTFLADSSGNAFRVEFSSADSSATGKRLSQITLKRVGDHPATLGEWTPDVTCFTGYMQDLDVRAAALSNGKLALTVLWNGRSVITHSEPNAANRTGRFGPWAGPNSEAWIDNLRCVPIQTRFQRTESQDEWQARHFPADAEPTATSAPGADPDGDGSSNAEEFLAGSNPLDSGSVWRCSARPAGRRSLTISWATIPMRSYLLETSSTLQPGTWAPASTLLTGTGTPATATVPIEAKPRFYRVRVSESP